MTYPVQSSAGNLVPEQWPRADDITPTSVAVRLVEGGHLLPSERPSLPAPGPGLGGGAPGTAPVPSQLVCTDCLLRSACHSQGGQG